MILLFGSYYPQEKSVDFSNISEENLYASIIVMAILGFTGMVLALKLLKEEEKRKKDKKDEK